MKTLYSSICEAVNSSNKKLEALYSLAPDADRNRCPKNLKSSRHVHEFMRGYFGDDEMTVLNNVKTMLESAGIDITNLNFEYGIYKDASGKYCAVKITANDNINDTKYGFKLDKSKYLYIINTVIGKSKIRAKTLSPDNLGLVSNSYSNKEDIIIAVKKGLKNKNLIEYEDVILALCNCIKDNSNDLTLDEILNHTISYTIDKTSIKNIDDISIFDFNNIANDFGEVLGLLMLMDKLTGDIKLTYPRGSNAKLFDYCINDSIWISAKSGKGAIPSSVDTMKAIEELYKNDNIDAVGEEKYFLEAIVPIIADNEKKESGSAIRRQTWRLALELSNSCSNIKTALKILTDYNLKISEKGTSEADINTIYKSNNLNELLTKYYSALAYEPSSKYSINNLISEFDTFDKKIKEGMILYPLKVAVTNYINTVYSEYINKYAAMVMNGYQMYLTHKIVGNNIDISFYPKQMSKGKFRLKAQGSVGEPLLKSMGIEMIK